MAVLLLAEVNNGELSMDATAKAVTAVAKLGEVHVLVRGQGRRRGGGRGGHDRRRRQGALRRGDHGYCHMLAEPVADLIVSLAGDYSHIAAPATTRRQERPAARRGAARRDGDLRCDRGRRCRHVRAPDLRGQRDPDGEIVGCQVKVMTIRTSSFDAAGDGQLRPGRAVGTAASAGLSEWVEDKVAASTGPS
jgi:electron transfer flavoprotein alpha subunit